MVARAYKEHRQIKVIGSKHSYNDSWDSKDMLISMKNFKRIFKIDKKNNRVKCEAGVSISEIALELHKNGFTLTTAGSFGEQTIAGAISTGTHGFSREGGLLSELVVEMEIIDGKGEIHDITKEKDLRAFRLSLGTLGIITKVTLQITPLDKYCTFEIDSTPQNIVYNNLETDVQSNKHIRYLLNQFNPDYFTVIKINEVNIQSIRKNAIRRRVHFVPGGKEYIPVFLVLLTKLFLTNRYIIKYVLRSASTKIHIKNYFLYDTGIFIRGDLANNHPVIGRLVYNALKTNAEYNSEIAINPNTFEIFNRKFITLLKKYQKNDSQFNAQLAGRFLGGNASALLAANYHSSVLFIDVHIYKNCSHVHEFLKEIEDFAMDNCEGKMHWGKMIMNSKERVLKNYTNESITTFTNYKIKYDPGNVFSNNYTRRLFGF
ncbi:MAG: FAD-binding oxidoreductase [bacterium]|nr:FAD-binding oxidoreductase [bacterium]